MQPGSLVLYKGGPALVKTSGDGKLLIEIADGASRKVRPKDVHVLHSGPLRSLAEMEDALHTTGQLADLETVADLIRGQACSLQEFSELLFELFTPSTAWASWQLVADDLHFKGSPSAIEARDADEIKALQARRHAAEQARLDLLEMAAAVERGESPAPDHPLVREAEDLARGLRQNSRLLSQLGRAETEINAHSLLLETGLWQRTRIPFLEAAGLPLQAPADDVVHFLPEERLDLTGVPALAIDDEGTEDPDDAIGLEDGRLWIHVADVASVVKPDSTADRDARARGSTLYLPDRRIPMIADSITSRLGLGLTAISPALSFGLDLSEDGAVTDLHIVPSYVKVERLSYAEAEARLDEVPLRGLLEVAALRRKRRLAGGAALIELPDARLLARKTTEARLDDLGYELTVEPLRPLRSRQLVSEAMITAGEALGSYAVEQAIPFPFSSQPPAAQGEGGETVTSGLAGMYALRRHQSPSRIAITPGRHNGLGLDNYARVTSPLRRYTDLLAHQQLRAHQVGGRLLSETEVLGRIGESEAVTSDLRRLERNVRRHWMLLYLECLNDWRGEAVLVARRGNRGTILIPDLAFEADIPLRDSHAPLNESLKVRLQGVNLPRLEAHFAIET